MKLRFAKAAAAVALMALPMSAHAASYVVNSAHFDKLGDQIGSDFDIVDFLGISGTFNGFGTYDVSPVVFTVGINANQAATSSGTFGLSGLFDGNPFSFTVPYTIDINNSDTITIGGNSLVAGGYKILFNQLTLNSGVGSTTGVLTATVTAVPEPATWAMLLVGFGAAGYSMRRRTARRPQFA